MIFLDHRFKQPSNTRNLPKWMRSSVTTFTSNASALKNLEAFYQRHEKLSNLANDENRVTNSQVENSIFSQTQPSAPPRSPRRLAKRKPTRTAKDPRESTAKFGFIDKYFTKTTKKAKTQDEGSDYAKAQTAISDFNSQVTQLQNHVPGSKFDDSLDTSKSDKLAAKTVLDDAMNSLRELKGSSEQDRSRCEFFDLLIQDILQMAQKRGIS